MACRSSTCTYKDECPRGDLTIACAWCGKPLGTKLGLEASGTSGSICAECEALLMAGFAEYAAEKEDE
jgi:hypothetical protein